MTPAPQPSGAGISGEREGAGHHRPSPDRPSPARAVPKLHHNEKGWDVPGISHHREKRYWGRATPRAEDDSRTSPAPAPPPAEKRATSPWRKRHVRLKISYSFHCRTAILIHTLEFLRGCNEA